MEARQPERLRQLLHIVGRGRGRGLRLGLDGRPAVSAAIAGDDAKPRGGEGRDLMLPDLAAARAGVEEHHGVAAAAGVEAPEPRAGNSDGTLGNGGRGGLGQHSSDEC